MLQFSLRRSCNLWHSGWQKRVAAAVVLQKRWRSRDAALTTRARYALSKLPPGAAESACARGWEGVAEVVGEAVGVDVVGEVVGAEVVGAEDNNGLFHLRLRPFLASSNRLPCATS